MFWLIVSYVSSVHDDVIKWKHFPRQAGKYCLSSTKPVWHRGICGPFYWHGCSVEVWEWISNFIPYIIMGVIVHHGGIKLNPYQQKGGPSKQHNDVGRSASRLSTAFLFQISLEYVPIPHWFLIGGYSHCWGSDIDMGWVGLLEFMASQTTACSANNKESIKSLLHYNITVHLVKLTTKTFSVHL